MATKPTSVSAAQKMKPPSLYFYDKKTGAKKLAVTAEQLNAWKKKNKGEYKGSALTAWANAKGKDVKKKVPKKDQKTTSTTVSDEQKKSQVKTKGPVRKGDGTEAGTKKAKKALPGSAESPHQTLLRLKKETDALQASREARIEKMEKMRESAAKLLEETKPKGESRSNQRFPTGKVSSARGIDSGPNTRAGDETNALDILAEKRARQKRMKDNMNKGGSVTKKSYSYNMGGLTRNSVNNLKRGRS